MIATRMRPRWLAGLLICVGTLAAFASTPAAQPTPLVVATYAYPNRDRAASITPLADYLGQQLQRKVQVKVLASPTDLLAAMDRKEVDVAVPNLYAYLRSRRGYPAIEALPVPDVPPAQAARYRAVIVARAPLTLRGLADQAPRLRLVLVGRDSASGGFVPVQGLYGQGIALDDFARVDYAGSHAAALQWLAEGKADMAALAADVFDAGSQPGLHEIWRSEVIPPGPLLCRQSPGTSCEAIAAALLRADQEDPRVLAGLRAGWPEFGDAQRMVPAPVEALDALADRLGQAR